MTTILSLPRIKHARPGQTSRLVLLTALSLTCLFDRTNAGLGTACASGEYLMLDTTAHNNRQGLCVTCPRGYECPTETDVITKPKKCNRGYYTGFGATACIQCPAGWYCDQPNVIPVPCPAGEYSSDGSYECQSCPAGSVCKFDGSELIICTSGQKCASGTTYAEALPCPAGKRCPDGATVANCASGYYSVQGSTTCTKCPVGYYCPSTDHEPLECFDGYYADVQGKTSCIECPQYSICTSKAKAPESCPPGSYSLLARSTTCTDCPAGASCAANSAPVACAVGEYSMVGMSSCSKCPAGYECEDQTEVGSVCGTGEYSLAGELHCNTCPAGSYCPQVYSQPLGCSAGWYSAPGSTVCTECDAGFSCSNPAAVPKQCEDGTMSEDGATFCVGCPAGQICTGGTPTECADDELPNQDGSACVQCPAGVACPGFTWARMAKCSPGYYSTLGMMHCEISPPGFFAATTTADPEECEDGYFADAGSTYCVQCPPGHECKDKTGRHNVMCRPGYYTTGDGTCEKCDAGKMCPIGLYGYVSPIDCVAGTFAPEGSFDCELCKPGMNCADDGSRATTGTACAAGTMQLGGAPNCQWCPDNHECPFQETIVRCPIYFYSIQNDPDDPPGECKPCPNGSTCQGFTQQDTDPVECTDGYYALPMDFVCKPCPKGHSCGGTGVTTPTKCAGGTYADEGMGSCDTCPYMYYSIPGSEYCSPVPEGHRINDANDDIQVCEQTTYSRWGETTCTTCPDGFLCPEMTGIPSYHNLCPRGSYCIGGVQTKCATGKFGTMAGAQTEAGGCADCPMGYNCQPGTAHFELVPCPAGGYCPRGEGAIACPAGTFNDNLYARAVSDCKTCPIGHQCGEESTDKGSICGAGFYCPRGSGDGSYPCPAGTHGNSQTGKKDINECIPCPPGNFCPEGSASPTPAPAGYYTPLSGMPSQESLYLCPPTFYCPNEGMTSYKGNFCRAGYVCPAGSTMENQVACPEGTFSDRRDLHDVKHCDICPKGYSCDAGSTTTTSGIVACPNHRYCPDGTKASKIPLCPPGTYAPFLNAKSLYDCLECPPGSYCDGTEDNTGTAVGPQTCESGHYCEPGTAYSDQSPCPPGYYNDLTGSHSINDCLHCGFNKYCPDWGEISATTCAHGTYMSESTSAILCDPCPAGYMCNQDGSFVYPVPCDAQFYSAKGSRDCTPCPEGHFCPNQATTEYNLKDQQCPKGTLCATTVTYTDVDGTLQNNIAAGIGVWPNKVKIEDGGHACPLYKFCPKGTKNALDIPRGTMQELFARGSLVDAIQMPPGNYTVLNVDAAVDQLYTTTECPPGYYCPPGSYEAIPCPTGFYRANKLGMDADSCGLCPAGTYCDTVGTHTPTICFKGHFCPEGAAYPQPCPLGTYNPGEGLYDSRGCTACDPGYYCPFMGQDQVYDEHICDAGYYCIAGSSRPEPTDTVRGSRCPAGRYCQAGAAAPTNCVPGKYGPYEGASDANECVDCKPGFYCLGEDATDATSACKAGYYCNGGTITYNPDAITGVYTNAGIAQPGYYAPEGSFEQIKCPEGKFTGDEGRETCDSCGAGFFCDGLMTTQEDQNDPVTTSNSVLCAVGHFCLSYEYYVTEQSSDASVLVVEYRQTPCPVGTYNPLTARTSEQDGCLACPAGKACEKKGLHDVSTLPDCAAGYFCKSGAISRFPDGVGTTQSGPCPVGHYCEAATTDPEPCLAGTFSNQLKATDVNFCMPCPPGYLCDSDGLSAVSSSCDSGKFCSDGTTQAGCAQTNTGGVYCPVASHFELICPMGFYQDNQNRGSCKECPKGNFCMNGLQTQCEPGFYCP